MRVLVLGSGVIGVTSAYYLARAGHEVTVVDREAGPALETSFANARQISPGYASPWAAPGVSLKAIKWMFQKHAPLSICHIHLSWKRVPSGRMESGACFWNIHLMALSGTPGAAHGDA